MKSNRTIGKTTVADIRHQFRAQGITISQWSEERGFSPALVYAVARGNRKCLRGQSHQIAVALGLKAP
jgi:gp16 family phage-associated protein